MTTAAPIDLDSLLSQAIELKASIELLQGKLASVQDQLTAAVIDGDLDPKFAHNDWAFSLSKGRTSYQYSTGCKAAIKELQEIDVAAGHAVQKTGAPFWVIKAPSI
jgi:hypothetical protein